VEILAKHERKPVHSILLSNAFLDMPNSSADTDCPDRALLPWRAGL